MSEQSSDVIDAKAADRRLNSIGYAAAQAAINAGAVSEAAWSFDAADGNALLGDDGTDWRRFGRAHLAVNGDEEPNTKARFSYPWGKLVGDRLTLFSRALRTIRSRASQQGDTTIFEAAGRLLDALGDGDGAGDSKMAQAFAKAALSDADRTPPETMAIEAARGLTWFQRYRCGGTAIELARALAIRARAPLPPETIANLAEFFADETGRGAGWSPGQRGYPSPARIRYALYGGESGYRWILRTGQAARSAARQKDADGLIHKGAIIHERSDAGVTFVASDESVDRMGDIILAKGWKLDNFRRNPQLLFGHLRESLPVGRVERVWVEGKRLLARATFLPEGVDEFADKVARLVRDGFLNAVSVAFVALKAEPRMDAEGRYAGTRFLEQELVELSIVPVPANPNAVAVARSAGFTDADLKRCFADPREVPGVSAPVRLEGHRVRLMRLRRCG